MNPNPKTLGTLLSRSILAVAIAFYGAACASDDGAGHRRRYGNSSEPYPGYYSTVTQMSMQHGAIAGVAGGLVGLALIYAMNKGEDASYTGMEPSGSETEYLHPSDDQKSGKAARRGRVANLATSSPTPRVLEDKKSGTEYLVR